MAVFQGYQECKNQIYGLHYNETDPLSRETRKLETSSSSHRVASKARPLQIKQAKVNTSTELFLKGAINILHFENLLKFIILDAELYIQLH